MKIITIKNFEDLASVKDNNCVSIYIPTQSAGENRDSHIRFKNKVLQAKNTLKKKGFHESDAIHFLKPCFDMVDDPGFWRQLSNGLAVFRSKDIFVYYHLPISFRDFYMVGNNFYLLPLIPVFNENGQYFLLALSQQSVRLFSASRDHISEINIADSVPRSISESVGEDYEQKSLQYQTGYTQGAQIMFHGQGSGKDDKKVETEKFLRDVDTHLKNVINDYSIPMIVAAVDNVFHLFKKVNTFPHLHEKFVRGNPDESDEKKLHKESWEQIKDDFLKDKEEKTGKYSFLASQDRTSENIEEIVPAAFQGKIDTLFVQKNQHIWGGYNEEYNSVSKKDIKEDGDSCLLDIAAKSTFLQQGHVYLAEEEEMPANNSPVNAIFRY
jgi:hypothetical protein